MTIASSTGISKAELDSKEEITVLKTLQRLEIQEKKQIIDKIMIPDKTEFKPGVLVLAGKENELQPAKFDTILKSDYLLKVTTIVGGG